MEVPVSKEGNGREREERLQVMLSDQELTLLDDWRFAMRMPSRAAAIRELLRRGLANIDVKKAAGNRKSTEFGVVEGKRR